MNRAIRRLQRQVTNQERASTYWDGPGGSRTNQGKREIEFHLEHPGRYSGCTLTTAHLEMDTALRGKGELGAL